jgi:hypothetical protein
MSSRAAHFLIYRQGIDVRTIRGPLLNKVNRDAWKTEETRQGALLAQDRMLFLSEVIWSVEDHPTVPPCSPPHNMATWPVPWVYVLGRGQGALHLAPAAGTREK